MKNKGEIGENGAEPARLGTPDGESGEYMTVTENKKTENNRKERKTKEGKIKESRRTDNKKAENRNPAKTAGTAKTKHKTAVKTGETAALRGKKAPAGRERQVEVPDISRPSGTPVFAEVLLWIMLALCLILCISNLTGFGGPIGRTLSGFFFGVFGTPAYLMPVLLFLMTAFLVANRGRGRAWGKVLEICFLLLTICCFCELLTGQQDAQRTFAEYYARGKTLRAGGGVAGGLFCRLFLQTFGTVGAWICNFALFLIGIIAVTGKSLFDRLQSGSTSAVKQARTRKNMRRELQHQKKKQQQLQKQVGMQKKIDRIRQENEGLQLEIHEPRRSRVISGVSLDTEMDPTLPGSGDVHEVIPSVSVTVGKESERLSRRNQTASNRIVAPRTEPETHWTGNKESGEQSGAVSKERWAGKSTAAGESWKVVTNARRMVDSVEKDTNATQMDLHFTIQRNGNSQMVESGTDVVRNESPAEYGKDRKAAAETCKPVLQQDRAGQAHTRSGVNSPFQAAQLELEGEQTPDFRKLEESGHRLIQALTPGRAGGSYLAQTGPATGNNRQLGDILSGANAWSAENGLSAGKERQSGRPLNGTDVWSAENTLAAGNGQSSGDNRQSGSMLSGTDTWTAETDLTEETGWLSGTLQQPGNHVFAGKSLPGGRNADAPAGSGTPGGRNADAPAGGGSSGTLNTDKAAGDGVPQKGRLRQPDSSKAEQKEAMDEVAREIQQHTEAEKPVYHIPPLDLLKKPSGVNSGNSDQEVRETAAKLQHTLDSFGVKVKIVNVSCGPSVTRYELMPEEGIKVSRIVNLADDIKLSLAAADIRIEAPIPGKSAVGIEVPNKETSSVYLRELLESREFQNSASKLSFAVGKDLAGKVVVTDIAKMPHLLIAGATGSGKSVCINTLIMSILYKADPEEVKLIMIDPKVVELSVYNGIPHLFIPVVTDPKKASGALNWAVAEMTDRYQKFAETGVRDLKGYNQKIDALEGQDIPDKPKKLPQIVIIVDELADLMMVAPGEVEDAICRLAQLARAAGIHLIIATQRPSVNVITGLIKANMPSRIAFSVTSGVDSRTILDMVGAEKLLGKGDMLFYPQGYPKPVRVQGSFVSDAEVSAVAEFLTRKNDGGVYHQEMEARMTQVTKAAASLPGTSSEESELDSNFAEAGRFIIEKEKASIGMLQRMFKIGFNRAARIMDQLADAGVVGPEEGTKPRKILMTMEEFEAYLQENGM